MHVAQVRGPSNRSRVLIEDVRANGAFLRVTFHDDAQILVVSHWQEGLCVATTRVPVSAAPSLVALLGDALASRSDEESLTIRNTG